MGINKVQYGNTVLIDLTDTTAEAADVLAGKYFYDIHGIRTLGTGSGGGGYTWETLSDQNVTIVSDTPNPNYCYWTFTDPLSANETYRITWGSGGTQYICETVVEPIAFTEDGYYLGNARIFGSQYPDTGEPFIMYRNSATRMIAATNQATGSWHIKVEKQVSSSATLIEKTITANGTYDAEDDDADGYSSVTVNVSGGGGGASNVVTGTFTGTTTGAAMDVTLNYSGSGHPVAVLIYPSEGAYKSSGTFYRLLQRYATCFFVGIKSDMSTTQDYNGSSIHGSYNQATIYNRYKSSATDYTKYTGNSSGYTEKLFVDTDATASDKTVVRIKSNTNMSVFIASSSYGFAANIEYKYWVLYSS